MALDWEKARAREKLRRSDKPKRTPSQRRLAAINSFANKHDLRCFVCSLQAGPWAKTGVSARGPWGLCVACAARPRE